MIVLVQDSTAMTVSGCYRVPVIARLYFCVRRIAKSSGKLPVAASLIHRYFNTSTLCVLHGGSIYSIYIIYRLMSRTSEPLLLSPAPQH